MGIPSIGAGTGWPFWGGLSVLPRRNEGRDSGGEEAGDAGDEGEVKDGKKGLFRRGLRKLRRRN